MRLPTITFELNPDDNRPVEEMMDRFLEAERANMKKRHPKKDWDGHFEQAVKMGAKRLGGRVVDSTWTHITVSCL
jgi:hypothetical protein